MRTAETDERRVGSEESVARPPDQRRPPLVARWRQLPLVLPPRHVMVNAFLAAALAGVLTGVFAAGRTPVSATTVITTPGPVHTRIVIRKGTAPASGSSASSATACPGSAGARERQHCAAPAAEHRPPARTGKAGKGSDHGPGLGPVGTSGDRGANGEGGNSGD